ncbi:hypothetical protein MF271_23185 (plasmid) [Deinococcus sp. KNUC1210]|uniref:RCC1 domain-containing protein n=1 Tax=Deinococcus sp. KNUC1210 TaxID=2917691 RepID=UPI001EF057CB|nr:hypothetical protein [Deinococcus sp. KNUC1210]ULH17882.1 hypothetical protein MF271_23185 [Deinococcus sp. KNUC1210]
MRRRSALSLLLLPALLLGACAQQSLTTQPTASTPVGSTLSPAGVYQVSFQNVGTGDFAASAQLAAPLRSQSLFDVPESAGGGFTFDGLGSATFVVKATGIRHVQATFKVTNNTGLTLNSLKFVPAIPTGGSTVFSRVTYFDGSDASSKASSLNPVQGQNFSGATGQAVTDAGSSPFVTGLDTSGVDTTGQGVSSVKPYGWQVASQLAPGGTAVVTFAVDLPADANPKNNPFNFNLNFIGVQDGTSLTSAVQQYNSTTKSFGNYVQFPTIGTDSLPAYYDVKNVDRNGTSIASVLCSFDGARVSNISTASFPNRYRVTMESLGAHTLQVFKGSSCPTDAGTGTLLLSQLVNGTTPARMPLASGYAHNLAVKVDSTVSSWGYNNYGQLGNGTTTNSSTPGAVSGLTNAVSVAGGYLHSLALKADGTVSSWGYNAVGQLGNGTTTNSTTPVAVSGLTNVISVSAGRFHSLALRADGTVSSWGYNYYGQLGNGTTTDSSTPVDVSGLTDVVSVAAGNISNLALKADGTVSSWGFNGDGELGNGTTINSSTPVTVSGLTNAVSVAAGNYHSLALKADGTVSSWGFNPVGQLGNGTTTTSTIPVAVTGLTNAVSVAAGNYHSLAVKVDGTVSSWGYNNYGQLGNGTTTNSNIPVAVSGLTNAVSVAGGNYHSLALKADGTVSSWGSNNYGQLGSGTTTDSSTPLPVPMNGVAQPTP